MPTTSSTFATAPARPNAGSSSDVARRASTFQTNSGSASGGGGHSSSFLQQRAAAWEKPGAAAAAPAVAGGSVHHSSGQHPVFSYSQAPRNNSTSGAASTSGQQRGSVGTSAGGASAGVNKGSLAHFMGSTLGVAHKGTHSGLVRTRVDQDEERARMEHANRGVNKEMARIITDVVKDKKLEAGAEGEAASIKFLAKKIRDQDKAAHGGAQP